MWKVKYVECDNFISFQHAELNILQNVCSLIYGINNDNMQQRNNGTGKSSIIEAIAFALTGEPLRQVEKVEEIINDHSDTANVFIELENDYDNTIFTIERKLDRKAAQIIECHKYDANDEEIEINKTSQPTVLDYNRYILDEIGLTKDDIYSNYILSNSKYKSFFDANDKAKKAMINRFSGADAVDEAIERLKVDKLSAEEYLIKAKEAVIALEAKVEVINGQLAGADEKKAEYESEKQKRIEGCEVMIAQKREELRENKELIVRSNARLDKIDAVGAKIEAVQGEEKLDLKNVYRNIVDLFGENGLAPIKDYVTLSNDIEKAIKCAEDEIIKVTEDLKNRQQVLARAEAHYKKVQEEVQKLKVEYDEANEKDNVKFEEICNDIANTKSRINEYQKKIKGLNAQIDNAEREIHKLANTLHGAIICPNCQHKFFLDDKMSVADVEKQLAKEQRNAGSLELEREKCEEAIDVYDARQEDSSKEKDAIANAIDLRNNKINELKRDINKAMSVYEDAADYVHGTERIIKGLNESIEEERGRIGKLMENMFIDALDVIDNTIERGENYVKTLEEKSVAINASIETLQRTIEETKTKTMDDFVSSLKESKTKYEESLSEAKDVQGGAQINYDRYVQQENYFIEFRSHLANKKVEAIAGVTNHFLELIGSDLRVEMLGFKKLKSGKIRDKITVNLLRNGVACGSYAKFSGGERARVNLASILGLQRLTNNSAPKGKGLNMIILDEVLEASDTTGIESSCKALNDLKVTSLMVTQNPISDNDGNTIVVTKENGYSTISK